MSRSIRRPVALTLSAALLAASMLSPAVAGNSTSLGHGIKCTWVLVSSINGVNTWKQVCRKGV